MDFFARSGRKIPEKTFFRKSNQLFVFRNSHLDFRVLELFFVVFGCSFFGQALLVLWEATSKCVRKYIVTTDKTMLPLKKSCSEGINVLNSGLYGKRSRRPCRIRTQRQETHSQGELLSGHQRCAPSGSVCSTFTYLLSLREFNGIQTKLKTCFEHVSQWCVVCNGCLSSVQQRHDLHSDRTNRYE